MDPNTFPTKGNLIAAKNSLKLATMGYGLMDKKRNILIRLFLLLSRKDWGAGRTLTNSYTFIRHIPVVIVMSVSHINRYAITQAG